MSFLNLELLPFSFMAFLALWPVQRYGVFSVMADATTHPTDKVLIMIGGHYERGKYREDWVGGIGGSKRSQST